MKGISVMGVPPPTVYDIITLGTTGRERTYAHVCPVPSFHCLQYKARGEEPDTISHTILWHKPVSLFILQEMKAGGVRG